MKTLLMVTGCLFLISRIFLLDIAEGAEITVTGDMEISKSVSMTQAGKVIRYPDGTTQGTAPKAFSKTLVISPRGTAVENGIALLEALLEITDATGSNLYLIHLEPGTYDLATESLVMKSYVSIEGSGEDLTLIKGSVSASDKGLIMGAHYCELRDCTIEHTGGGAFAIGVYNSNASPDLTNLTIKAANGQESYAIYNKNSAPAINRVSCTASGTGDISCGIYHEGGNPTSIMNVTIKASGSHNNYGVWNTNGSSTILRHITADITGGTDCYGIFNYNSDCDMMFITASASGGENLNAGVFNSYSTASMVNITVNSSGGANNNYGVANSHSSPILMNNVKATASGGANAYGVYNNMSESSLTNVYAEGSGGGTKSWGMINFPDSGTSSYTLAIDRSTFKGTDESISSSAKYTMNIGLSKLEGPASGGGTWHCVGCFNWSYAELGGDCQLQEKKIPLSFAPSP